MRELNADEIELAAGGYVILRKMVDALVTGQAFDWAFEEYRDAVNAVDNRAIEQSAFAQWAGQHYSAYGFCNF